MAAEVPVNVVLCEAMEYLVKLGSNLLTRSENLKQKKIRRDKLKNAHAIQKAASKVLLICELSKKSLENVETGVRNVLRLVNNGQTPSNESGKESQSSRTTVSPYQYFNYKSRRLKISKNVPIKHYLAAKVVVNKLSKSEINKYPVYHNCKLYRSRRRKSLERREKQRHSKDNVLRTPIHSEDDEIDKNSDFVKSNDKADQCLSSVENVAQTKTIEQSQENICTENNINTAHVNNSEIDIHEISSSHTKVNDSTKGKDTSELIEEKSLGSIESNKEIKKSKHLISQISDDEEELTHFDRSVEKSDSHNDDTTVNLSSSSTKEADQKNRDSADPEPNDQATEDKNIVNLDSDCEVTDEKPQKPLIKCVNINFLLKPDVAQTNVNKPTIQSESFRTKKSINHSHSKDEKLHSDKTLLDRKTKQDEVYWEQKRKEVAKFKSKSFSIKLSRLPKFSEEFLNAHNITKVIKGGKIVYEIPNQLCNKTEKVKLDSEDTVSAKNSLLNNSDTDDDRTNHNMENAAVDSGKENNVQGSKTIDKNIEIVKEALLNDSDSDSNEKCLNNQNPPSVNAAEKNSAGMNEEEEKVIENEKSVTLYAELPSADPKTNSNVHENEEACSDFTDGLKNDSGNNTLKNPDTETPGKIKSAVINDSSDDSTHDTQVEAEKKVNRIGHSKRNSKDVKMAKRVLLTSSSDDEPTTKKSSSNNSDDDTTNRISHKRNRKKSRISSSSSSTENLLQRVRKKMRMKDSDSDSDKEDENITQVDGNVDNSDSNSSKVMYY